MRFSRLSRAKRLRLVHLYIEDVGATTAARIIGLNRKTLNSWYRELRSRIVLVVPSLPPIRDPRGFRGYHVRRIAKCNGLFQHAHQYHLFESRVRYQLRSKFKATVLKLADDLLE